jgi:hypothetical protein
MQRFNARNPTVFLCAKHASITTLAAVLGSVPVEICQRIFANSARFFRCFSPLVGSHVEIRLSRLNILGDRI